MAGVFYRPDSKSMINFSGSIGANDNMVGFGYSQRFGEVSGFDGMTDEELKNALSEMSGNMKTVKQENIALLCSDLCQVLIFASLKGILKGPQKA